jgi:hypothetical protein
MGTVQHIVRDILNIPTSEHDPIQNAIKDRLDQHGQIGKIEHLIYRSSNRIGYMDNASLGPIKIGIEVDHSLPRHNSIQKLNLFKGDISIIVLKGKTAGTEHKVNAAGKRCKELKTPFAVLDLTNRIVMLSSPGLAVA